MTTKEDYERFLKDRGYGEEERKRLMNTCEDCREPTDECVCAIGMWDLSERQEGESRGAFAIRMEAKHNTKHGLAALHGYLSTCFATMIRPEGIEAVIQDMGWKYCPDAPAHWTGKPSRTYRYPPEREHDGAEDVQCNSEIIIVPHYFDYMGQWVYDVVGILSVLCKTHAFDLDVKLAELLNASNDTKETP
tara:strand:- start:241 stop:813 length:573 start_codon:yes stop_codon:yes gene_type:complete